ncbi:hypothetical protein [Clostridium sp.]|jgi:cell division protein YceG involved in septum cleavage|uniref:hypothetical protein n=1 Tax=Clostridium sp. TaxID=1506 RepID=UPI002FDE165D
MKDKLKLLKDKLLKSKARILGIIIVILVIIAGITGYFYHKKLVESRDPVKIEAAKTDKKLGITEDESNTKKLKREDIILNGRIYTQNNKVIVTMVIKEGVSDQKVKELAQEYGKNLKEKYEKMPVNVIAVRGNKKVLDITVK